MFNFEGKTLVVGVFMSPEGDMTILGPVDRHLLGVYTKHPFWGKDPDFVGFREITLGKELTEDERF